MLHQLFPLSALFGLGATELAIIVAIFGMIFGGIIGIAGMYFEHQRKKLAHDVARLALEKGQPVPSEFAAPAHRNPDDRRHPHPQDLRSGMVLISVGAGVFLFLNAVSGVKIALLGAVPAFIGFALILNWLILGALARKQNNPPPPAT